MSIFNTSTGKAETRVTTSNFISRFIGQVPPYERKWLFLISFITLLGFSLFVIPKDWFVYQVAKIHVSRLEKRSMAEGNIKINRFDIESIKKVKEFNDRQKAPR